MGQGAILLVLPAQGDHPQVLDHGVEDEHPGDDEEDDPDDHSLTS